MIFECEHRPLSQQQQGDRLHRITDEYSKERVLRRHRGGTAACCGAVVSFHCGGRRPGNIWLKLLEASKHLYKHRTTVSKGLEWHVAMLDYCDYSESAAAGN